MDSRGMEEGFLVLETEGPRHLDSSVFEGKFPDLANRNIGHQIHLEFQINSRDFLNMSHPILGTYLYQKKKKVFVLYLKFQFNWTSCILPGHPV